MTILKKIFGALRARAQGALFAAFAPLADVTQSGKLSALYNSDANLATYINSMFKIAISVGAIIAVIRLGVAGFKYMGGDMWHTKEKAKEDIREVFFGLLLLLSIWIILKQINPNLLNLNIVFPKTAEITAPPKTVSREQDMLGKILQDEDVKRGMLKGSGVSINKPPCRMITDTQCTNVGLLGLRAITGLKILKMNCRCSVMVSGGTEWFLHSENTTHGPNSPVVDILKYGGELDRYIRTNGTITRYDSKGRAIYSLDGGSFLDEDSAHWHVSF